MERIELQMKYCVDNFAIKKSLVRKCKLLIKIYCMCKYLKKAFSVSVAASRFFNRLSSSVAADRWGYSTSNCERIEKKTYF